MRPRAEPMSFPVSAFSLFGTSRIFALSLEMAEASPACSERACFRLATSAAAAKAASAASTADSTASGVMGLGSVG